MIVGSPDLLSKGMPWESRAFLSLFVAECSVYKSSSKIIGHQNRVTALLNHQHCCPVLSLQNLHGKFIATDYEQRRMPRNPPR